MIIEKEYTCLQVIKMGFRLWSEESIERKACFGNEPRREREASHRIYDAATLFNTSFKVFTSQSMKVHYSFLRKREREIEKEQD